MNQLYLFLSCLCNKSYLWNEYYPIVCLILPCFRYIEKFTVRVFADCLEPASRLFVLRVNDDV